VNVISPSAWFDFGEDVLGLYPFKARCIAAKFAPQTFPELLETGRATIEWMYSARPVAQRGRLPRQLRYGRVFVYFPERWLATREKGALMSAFVDVHEDFPLSVVAVVTGEPVILSDFTADMIRIMEIPE
jgi:hypothetical protein